MSIAVTGFCCATAPWASASTNVNPRPIAAKICVSARTTAEVAMIADLILSMIFSRLQNCVHIKRKLGTTGYSRPISPMHEQVKTIASRRHSYTGQIRLELHLGEGRERAK